MRIREFRHAVDAEFGDRAPALLADLVLGEIGGLTAEQGLAAGVSIDDVWIALCRATEVPPDRRHGVGLRDPRR